MPRIEMPNVVAFKVVLTEYERGWGQKHWDTWYFDNEEEARQAAIASTESTTLQALLRIGMYVLIMLVQ